MFAYLQLMSILNPHGTRFFILVAIVALVLIICKLRKGKKEVLIDEMKPSEKKDLLIGLRDNASAFAELYEPLYRLSTGIGGRKDWIFNSFNRIVNEIEGYDAFRLAFAKRFGSLVSVSDPAATTAKKAAKKDKKRTKKCRKAAKKLIKLMERAGIVRDSSSTVKADEVTAESYDTVGTASLTTGAVYDVLAPFWTLLIKEREYPGAAPAAPETEEKTEAPAAEENTASEENSAEEVTETAATEAPQDKKAAKKEKKAAKNAAKNTKKADKKAAKKAKKAAKKSVIVIKETSLLCKGAVR